MLDKNCFCSKVRGLLFVNVRPLSALDSFFLVCSEHLRPFADSDNFFLVSSEKVCFARAYLIFFFVSSVCFLLKKGLFSPDWSRFEIPMI